MDYHVYRGPILVTALLCLLAGTVFAQKLAEYTYDEHASKALRSYTTYADGHPDLSGVWDG